MQISDIKIFIIVIFFDKKELIIYLIFDPTLGIKTALQRWFKNELGLNRIY